MQPPQPFDTNACAVTSLTSGCETGKHFLFLMCSYLPPPRALWFDFSLLLPLCLSIRLSVCLTVRCLFVSSLSVCLFFAPAPRDERKEPLALACEHHHCCDWHHRHCCPGDHSSFAEQAPSPKIQGRVQIKNKKLLIIMSWIRILTAQIDCSIEDSASPTNSGMYLCSSVCWTSGWKTFPVNVHRAPWVDTMTSELYHNVFDSDTKQSEVNILLVIAAAFINCVQACSYCQRRRTTY